MNRSHYIDDIDSQEAQWALIRWRGAVKSAIRGKRGQAVLRELRDALDAMPNKRLIEGELHEDGEYCALGALAKYRGWIPPDLDMEDPDAPLELAAFLNMTEALTKEVMFENDEGGHIPQTPEERWQRMRRWTEKQIASSDA